MDDRYSSKRFAGGSLGQAQLHLPGTSSSMRLSGEAADVRMQAFLSTRTSFSPARSKHHLLVLSVSLSLYLNPDLNHCTGFDTLRCNPVSNYQRRHFNAWACSLLTTQWLCLCPRVHACPLRFTSTKPSYNPTRMTLVSSNDLDLKLRSCITFNTHRFIHLGLEHVYVNKKSICMHVSRQHPALS